MDKTKCETTIQTIPVNPDGTWLYAIPLNSGRYTAVDVPVAGLARDAMGVVTDIPAIVDVNGKYVPGLKWGGNSRQCTLHAPIGSMDTYTQQVYVRGHHRPGTPEITLTLRRRVPVEGAISA